jgi:Ca2+-binding EF-hand superfamily protein
VFRALGKAPTQAEVKELLAPLKEFVDLAEFKNLYRAKAAMRTPKKLEEDMLNCFRACDREGCGQVHEAELRQTLSTLGDVLTPNEVDELLKTVTINSSGMIDYDKFVQILIEQYPPDL